MPTVLVTKHDIALSSLTDRAHFLSAQKVINYFKNAENGGHGLQTLKTFPRAPFPHFMPTLSCEKKY